MLRIIGSCKREREIVNMEPYDTLVKIL